MTVRRVQLRWLFLLTAFCAPAFSVTPQNSPTTASAWVQASRSCAGELCRYDALQQALQIDSNNVAAHVALGEYYLGREQYETARVELELARKSDPRDWRARKLLADLDVRAGRLDLALASYRAVEQECTPSPVMDRDLAAAFERIGMLTDAIRVAQRAIRANASDGNSQSLLLRLVKRTRNANALQGVYEQILAADPKDWDALAHAALLQLQQGDRTGAEQRLRDALANAPDNADLKRALAQLRGPVALDELTGESARLHNVWTSASQEREDSDSEFLADVPALLRTTKQATDGSDAVILADVRIDRVAANGLATSHIQQVTRIGSEAGARQYSTRTVQYSPTSETLSIIHARLHKADGRVIEADDAGDDRVADRATAMYYDARARSLRFSSAKPGDVVELEYRITPATETNPYGNYFASLQMFRSRTPELMKRYVVVADAKRKLFVSGQSMPEMHTSESDGLRTYVWEAANMQPLPSEPLGPSATEFAPYVNVSTLKDTAELGQWYAAMLGPQLQLNDELRKVAATIEHDNPAPIDRVRAVYQFVLTSTHYVALEFGIYSYKPYPVSEVYARRFGDCKDKASLIIALLRAMNVNAEFALVRTRPLGPMAENAASVALFNHAIVYVPQFDLWLDGTADYYGMRELPQDDQGALAVTVDAAGRATRRIIPVSRPTDNLTVRRVEAQIAPNGLITFTGSSTTRGEDAPALRRDYEVQERQRETVRRGLADVLPTVKLEQVSVQHGDPDHSVEVNFAGTLDSYLGQRTLDLRTTWMQRNYLQKLALLSDRTQDVQLGSPWTTEEEFHFRLPRGASVATLPQDTHVKTSFGQATLRYSVAKGEVVVRTDVSFVRTRIERAEYPQFREFCAQLEQLFRREVKVVLQ